MRHNGMKTSISFNHQHDSGCCPSPADHSCLKQTDAHQHCAHGEHAHQPEHSHDHDHGHHHDHSHSDCGAHACGSAQQKPVSVSPLAAMQGALLLHIPAMDCPVEENMIRNALEKMPDVQTLRFDLASRSVAIHAPEASWPGVIAAIEALGLKTEKLDQVMSAGAEQHQQRKEQLRIGAALAIAAVAEMLHYFAPPTLVWQIAGMTVAAAAIALAGTAVFKKGLFALLRGQLNINALMTVAVTGAFLIGQWPEAAMVMALYSLAELIEARAVERARNAIKGLLNLAPETAEVRQENDSWRNQAVATVAVGAIVRVKPGERLPLDGRVTNGSSAVDQAPITGESVPVEKAPGDEVFAGTINQHGALEFTVTRPAGGTVLARIIQAVEEAQNKRASIQRFVDKFATYYTPAVFIFALLIAISGPWLVGWSWATSIYKALVLLVISCPCALVIATPVTVVSGLATAARRGILIKGGVYLEEARKLTVIALDKTGTITEGKPKLVAQESIGAAMPEHVWAVAHGLASRSDHPVAQAIANGLDVTTSSAVEGFTAEAGKGVRGTQNGQEYFLGNYRWMQERGLETPELLACMHTHEQQGRSVTLLANRNTVLALFAVADTIKHSTRQAIAQLKALGVRTVMLTGDNATTAQAIAQQAGVHEVKAHLLPQQKLNEIQELMQTGTAAKGAQRIGMVGDGINDAPALAAAHIGFAMGQAGTDTATEAADVIIMNDDLRRVPETIALSRRTYRVLWQNIALALGIKIIFLLLALLNNASMWMAVFADVGASLLVILNGLRLLRLQKTKCAACQAHQTADQPLIHTCEQWV